MDIWSELTTKPGLHKNYDYLVKKFDAVFHTNYQTGTAYLPLHFWFCKNSSSNNSKNNMVFPMASLYNSKVELIFKTRTLKQLTINKNLNSVEIDSDLDIISGELLVDYIILDKNSLNELQNPTNENYYLITQVQEIDVNIPANTEKQRVDLSSFKYNVIELIWVVVSDTSISKRLYFEYQSDTVCRDPIVNTTIKFDGVTRVDTLPSEYFQSVEPLSVHDSTPFSYIHCYSFALKPEDYSQPSGVCNFSEISTPTIELDFQSNISASTFKIFAFTYNVLIISNGQGRLLNSLSKSSASRIPRRTKNTPPVPTPRNRQANLNQTQTSQILASSNNREMNKDNIEVIDPLIASASTKNKGLSPFM